MSGSVQIEMSDINSNTNNDEINEERDINKEITIDNNISCINILFCIIHGLATIVSYITGFIYLTGGSYLSLMFPLASVSSINILLLILIIIKKKCIKKDIWKYDSRIEYLFIYFKIINHIYFILWLSLDAPVLAIKSGKNISTNILIKYGLISAPITYIVLPIICMIIFRYVISYYMELYSENQNNNNDNNDNNDNDNDNNNNNDNDNEEITCNDKMMKYFRIMDCCAVVANSYIIMIPIGLLLFHLYIFFETLITTNTASMINITETGLFTDNFFKRFRYENGNNVDFYEGSYVNLYLCNIKIILYIMFVVINHIQNEEISFL